MKDNYLIYLKPGAVNWDNYLPVLINLKKKNNLDVYLDDLNILSQFDINNNSHNFFFQIVNRYYIKIDENIYYLSKEKIIKLHKLVKSFNIRKNIFKQIYLKIISSLTKFHILKINILNHKYFILDINQVVQLYKIVDIKNIKKLFILRHGINIFDKKNTKDKSFITKLETNYIKKNKSYLLRNFHKKLFFLPYSNSEYFFYKENLKNLKFGHKTIGIPKHSKGWLNRNFSQIKRKTNNYILIISRPSNQTYFKKNIKNKSITNIIKLAKKNNLNIVYKFHPKESAAVIKREIKVLTKKLNFNDRFLFSEKNTYYLAKHSSFNISFYSSVCLDMIKLGLTPVEYIEKNKIKSSDFAKYNLTLFCNNEKDLNEIFNKIKKNPHKINKQLQSKYNSIFKKKISISKIISIINDEKNK